MYSCNHKLPNYSKEMKNAKVLGRKNTCMKYHCIVRVKMAPGLDILVVSLKATELSIK